ncbi:hypothetical protein H7X46_20955 [Pseudonocardia sp. C8]|uniref:hypothetical protein n=1 Tax=Pseudonocardia sp. C8 TaxID=2762759 RepID=UPI00164331A4|nr:hypothetical protein [Pseudonocardia sp. C8]MBC3193531.1 hypothetical protein [Pseudonocardia sp. C8]
MRTNRPVVPRAVRDGGRDGEWRHLLLAQAGMVHIEQLRTLGLTKDDVLAQVAAGRWNGFVRAVYATFTGPLPRESLIAGALLYGGPVAVLSHRTAAEEWGLVPVVAGPVHLTVPYTSSAVCQPEIVVHRSRAHRHIAVKTHPPRTSRADTAIDLAVEEPSAREARGVLLSLLTGGRVSPLEVEQRLVERPPRRYRRAMESAIRTVRDGVQSALEDLYLTAVEQAHGLPVGRRQTPFSVDGITCWEDVTYDDSGCALTVRLDGRTHLRADVAFRDRRRDNAAELRGRSRLVFGWRDLASDPCAAAWDIAAVLHRRGWTGQLRPCSDCVAREWFRGSEPA